MPRYQDRADAKALFNITFKCNINLGGCPESHPANVIQWLRDSGQIEVQRRTRSISL